MLLVGEIRLRQQAVVMWHPSSSIQRSAVLMRRSSAAARKRRAVGVAAVQQNSNGRASSNDPDSSLAAAADEQTAALVDAADTLLHAIRDPDDGPGSNLLLTTDMTISAALEEEVETLTMLVESMHTTAEQAQAAAHQAVARADLSVNELKALQNRLEDARASLAAVRRGDGNGSAATQQPSSPSTTSTAAAAVSSSDDAASAVAASCQQRRRLSAVEPPTVSDELMAVFCAFEELGDEMRFLLLQTKAFLEDMARFKLVDRAAAGPHPSALELRAHADCRALHGLLLDLDWENPMNPRRGPGYGIWTRLSTAAYTVGRASRTRLLRTAQGLKCVPEELLSTSNADFPTAAGEPARLDSAQEMTESDHAVLLQFAQRYREWLEAAADGLESFGCRSMPYAETADSFARQLRALEKEVLAQRKAHHHLHGHHRHNGSDKGGSEGSGGQKAAIGKKRDASGGRERSGAAADAGAGGAEEDYDV